MQYVLLVYGNDEAWNDLSTERKDALEAAHRDVLADLAVSGELALSNELSTTDAKIAGRLEETTFSAVEIRALMH
ncbi:hypothetical protein [Agromyces larvae]|uniref:YCII-related domain-containing protein n=1 Tax=Agromyces larvae TaxID=2929802 RepID=A0ABY4C268_9MICO|nr:hypothetical protein [Agromyces larvae]UOE45575.1 hypothetical protein MTO99_07425 [Agromyces larvae]